MADPANSAQRMAAKATGINPITTAKPKKQPESQHVLEPLSPDQNELLQAFLMTAKDQKNLVPGLGLADTAYDPIKGLNDYNAEKADRKRRVEVAMDKLGIKHTPVMARMNMTPVQAIMHARGLR